MQIHIPDEVVPEISRRAAAAGFSDINQYVLQLVLPVESSSVDATTERAINAGIESGVSATPLKEFLAQLRARLTSPGAAAD